MDQQRDNFELWYGQPIELLMQQRHAGFVLLMAAFPLLERLLVACTSSKPSTVPFVKALYRILPEIGSAGSAKIFWNNYRDDLLHIATLSKWTHGINPDGPIVERADDGRVWLNPALFASRVLAEVRGDFETFTRGKKPLATTEPVISLAGTGVNWYAGTTAPRRRP